MNESPQARTVPSAQGVESKASPFSVEETLQRLKESIQSRNLTIFAQIDHSDEAERVSLTMQQAHVLIFGSPEAGTPLMVASPLLALELPLKALVWQDLTGQVWVSYESSAYLASRFAVPAELVKNIAGIDGVVASALQQ
ncbi:MAG: DUF302 domain-containing protein [Ktedonobacterales bacterium]